MIPSRPSLLGWPAGTCMLVAVGSCLLATVCCKPVKNPPSVLLGADASDASTTIAAACTKLVSQIGCAVDAGACVEGMTEQVNSPVPSPLDLGCVLDAGTTTKAQAQQCPGIGAQGCP